MGLPGSRPKVLLLGIELIRGLDRKGMSGRMGIAGSHAGRVLILVGVKPLDALNLVGSQRAKRLAGGGRQEGIPGVGFAGGAGGAGEACGVGGGSGVGVPPPTGPGSPPPPGRATGKVPAQVFALNSSRRAASAQL